MKNALLHYLTFILLTFGFTALDAQTCYIQKDEASGFDVQPYQAELDSAACQLVAAMPDSFANQFKVFSFGFYMDLEYYSGYSYPQAFLDMEAAVAQESPYYLLIGRQNDHTGVFTKFWVKVKLPNEGIFYCIDQLSSTLRDEINQKFTIIANTIHQINGNSPSYFDVTEQGTMDSLINYISDLNLCCLGEQRGYSGCTTCAFSKTQFKSLLLSEGLLDLNVGNIIDETQQSTSDEEIGFQIEIAGQMIDLDNAIDTLKAHIHAIFPHVSIKVYPFNYNQYCSNFAGIKSQYLNDDVIDLGILIGVVGENHGSGTVYWQMVSRDASVPEPVSFSSNICYFFNSEKFYVRNETCGNGPRGIIENYENYGFDYQFTFADPEITPLTLTTGNVYYEDGTTVMDYSNTSEPLTNRVITMTKPMIYERLALGTAFEPKTFAPWTLLWESGGSSQPFDFSAKDFFLDRQNYLFITDIITENGDFLDVAHNFRNMGNFLWGASTYIMGVPEWLALLGAHSQNMFGEFGTGGWDAPDDQYSIRLGRYYAKRMKWKTNYAGRNNVFKN